jgi:hypothetical protein
MLPALTPLATFLALLLIFSGCGKLEPSQKAEVGPNQVMLRLRLASQTPIAELPRRVYIFPPLRCDETGKPEQSFRRAESRDGSVQWLPPDEKSALWLTSLQELLVKEGYQSVSYDELTRPGSSSAHDVLVINAYYSQPYRIGRGSQAAYSLFVRVSGATYPLDLDPSGKREHFLQIVTAFFLDRRQADQVPPIAMAAAINLFGSNGLVKGRVPLDITTGVLGKTR